MNEVVIAWCCEGIKPWEYWQALKLRSTTVPSILISAHLALIGVRLVFAGVERVATRQGGWERRRVRRVIQLRRFPGLLVVCTVKSHPGTQDIAGIPDSSPVQEEESEKGKSGESYDTSNDNYHDQRIRWVISRTPVSPG